MAAGRPGQGLQAWGSFEEWSGIVRSALVWAGLPDCRENCEELRQTADTEAAAVEIMLDAIESLDRSGGGLKVAELLKIASGAAESFNQSDSDTASEAIEALCESFGKPVSPGRLGNRLGHYRNRIVGGRALDFRTIGGNRFWFVRRAESGSAQQCHSVAESEPPKSPDVADWDSFFQSNV